MGDKGRNPCEDRGRSDVPDIETEECRTLDKVDGLCVIDVAYSPDGRVLAAAYGLWWDGPGYVRIWDIATGKAIGEPFLSPHDAWAVAFHPDGSRLAVGASLGWGRGGQVEIWDWRSAS